MCNYTLCLLSYNLHWCSQRNSAAGWLLAFAYGTLTTVTASLFLSIECYGDYEYTKHVPANEWWLIYIFPASFWVWVPFVMALYTGSTLVQFASAGVSAKKSN